jgi:hypothetical protein
MSLLRETWLAKQLRRARYQRPRQRFGISQDPPTPHDSNSRCPFVNLPVLRHKAVMTWVRPIGAGATSVRACSSGVSWAPVPLGAPTTSTEAGTTTYRTSPGIPGNTIGAGATDAQGCSSPETPRQAGARQAAVTSTSPAVTTVCSPPGASQTGSGATDVRACSTQGTQVPGTARQAVDTTTRAAETTAPPERTAADPR